MAESCYIPVLEHFEGPDAEERTARFWSKVDRRGPDECWPWAVSRTQFGYGRFKVRSYVSLHSNRVAWALHNQKEPGPLVVRHSCDNPRCCNPAHLLVGTIADNNRDKLERGRCRSWDSRGSKNPRAKLREEHIPGIVDRFRRGHTNTAIARDYPVGHAVISRVRLGLSWRAETERLGWAPRSTYHSPTLALGGGL